MKQSNLIVFFVPPEKVVNGGIMSIFSQCKEARRFYDVHKSETLICTYPGNKSYEKNDLFENDEKVYSFDQIINRFKKPNKIIIHVPETGVRVVNKAFQEKKYSSYLMQIKDVHINVMNQNIALMRNPSEFAELFKITQKVTQTTAHIRYTTQELSNKYQTPVHHLSVFIDPSQYNIVPYEKKKNLIIYSPDENPNKEKVLKIINSMGIFETKEIKGIPYEEYKKLASSAKFAITFREGFDGYFIESFFSGSIGMAVYNDDFFPDKSFLDIPSVFNDYDSMTNKLSETIKRLNEEKTFNDCVSKGKSKIEKIYSHEVYLRKMEAFYKGIYDFLPEQGTAAELIANILSNKDELIKQQVAARDRLKKQLAEEEQKTKHLKIEFTNLINSRSWKLTKPLRKLNDHKPAKK